MSLPLVSLQGAGYRYPGSDRFAVDQVSIDLWSGETVAITGSSASGKSTTLGIMSGEFPQLWGGRFSGVARWDSLLTQSPGGSATADITKIGALLRSPRDQLTGFAETVRDELAFDLEARGWDHSALRDRVELVSEALGISHLLDRGPFTLSGGERQRLALALAGVSGPRLLVLDDPEAHLDAYSRESWLAALRGVSGDNTTIAFEMRGRAGVTDDCRVFSLGSSPARSESALTNRSVLPAPTHTVTRLRLLCRRGAYDNTGPSVVENLDISLEGGRCLGLFGPNGTGKSTILRAFAGALPVFEGELQVDGRNITNTPIYERCRMISLALQDPRDQLFQDSVAKELAFGARLVRRMSGRPLGQLVTEYAERLGIGHLLARHPREISRSETRWVGIGSILVLGAPVLLLDEPTVGMDQDGVDQLSSIIADHKATGGCLIVTSHDRQWLESVADSVVTVGSPAVKL